MFGRDDYIFHSGILGQLYYGIGVEAGGVEGRRFGHIFFDGDSRLRRIHYPFGIPVIYLVLPHSLEFGVEPEMDEHGVIAVLEHDLLGRPCVFFL